MSNMQAYDEYYNTNFDTEAQPTMQMTTGGNITEKYKSQIKQAGDLIKVDPADRFKTEQQRAFTNKNLKRLLQKAAGNPVDVLAARDRDFMEYTQTLNAQEAGKC
jgi:hypothetical protein